MNAIETYYCNVTSVSVHELPYVAATYSARSRRFENVFVMPPQTGDTSDFGSISGSRSCLNPGHNIRYQPSCFVHLRQWFEYVFIVVVVRVSVWCNSTVPWKGHGRVDAKHRGDKRWQIAWVDMPNITGELPVVFNNCARRHVSWCLQRLLHSRKIALCHTCTCSKN